MNSYGDSSSPRARAQIPGQHGDPGGDASGSGWSAAQEGTAPAGRASVAPRAATGGRASVGGSAAVPTRGGSASGSASAAVPPRAGSAAGAASVGSASVGRAGPGRASVPAPGAGRAGAGRASVPVSPAAGGSAGRASVGSASVGTASAGRASVGSAAVGGVSGRASARASVSGGPGGPGGPTGPGRRGRGAGDPAGSARAKKRKRVNMLIASFAVFIMLAGLGVVGFTYYSTNVVLPEDTTPPQATTLYAFDNKTIIAKVGEQNRTLVTIDQIPQHVQDAVAAAEDRNFYEHSGVDYKGIVRAAWNNVSGGSKQGASTITQQYARNAFDNLKDDTYARKVKEAILASKLNDEYTKPQIMQHYLNIIYFGRGAHGIEAAAGTYFGKSASKLTVAEGAVLAALIKQPEAGAGHRGYDPAVNPTDAKSRWEYVIGGMVAEGWLNAPGKPPAPTVAEYPTKTLKKPNQAGAGLDYGVNTPYGNVINYVKQEMRDKGICVDSQEQVTDDKPLCSQALMSGGYRIRTTIDKNIQAAAVETAQRKSKGSELSDQPKNIMAAVVAIEPKTGRVLAYYGGDNGTGTDYAGKNTDSAGNVTGGHPPGSSFKIYTLAAALKEGKALESRWKGKAFTPKGTKFKVSNAGVDNPECGNSCTLTVSTLKSLNVPFYHVSEDIGPDKVVDMAAKAGVSMMWRSDTNPPKGYDLTKTDPKDIAPSPFFHVVGYGQYPITVLDHANGVATFANQGRYNKAHFLYSVEKRDEVTGKWKKIADEGQLKGEQRIDRGVVADVTSVLEQYPARVNHKLDDGRKAASKTGTWELKANSDDNGDAWMIGYTPQIATAVWVGNVDARKPLRLTNGNKVGGSNLPGDIWERFMDKAHKGKEKADFPPAANVGDPNTGNGEAPPPPPPPTNPPDCGPLGLLCPPGGNNGGNNGGGNNGGGNTPGGPTAPTNPIEPRPGGGGGLLPSTSPRPGDD
ncbi:transglycosylase domain-containing protein [Micromonospora sp. NPDC048170]|uniref:transglycosylase domain-containing protein n=1 Tax=Micromonospora sp. NPDC048170 TaxID=3154819 RepID=UPI0033DFF991